MKKMTALERKGLKRKTFDKKIGNPTMQGAQKRNTSDEKREPQNARGSKRRPPMKKEATLKCKGLKKESHLRKKRQHQNAGG
jgi:hypothetical protein